MRLCVGFRFILLFQICLHFLFALPISVPWAYGALAQSAITFVHFRSKIEAAVRFFGMQLNRWKKIECKWLAMTVTGNKRAYETTNWWNELILKQTVLYQRWFHHFVPPSLAIINLTQPNELESSYFVENGTKSIVCSKLVRAHYLPSNRWEVGTDTHTRVHIVDAEFGQWKFFVRVQFVETPKERQILFYSIICSKDFVINCQSDAIWIFVVALTTNGEISVSIRSVRERAQV